MWAHQVVGDGMVGSLCEISREACLCERTTAGFRAFIVLQAAELLMVRPPGKPGTRKGEAPPEPNTRRSGGNIRDNITRIREGR